jgi:hypothetical protein
MAQATNAGPPMFVTQLPIATLVRLGRRRTQTGAPSKNSRLTKYEYEDAVGNADAP